MLNRLKKTLIYFYNLPLIKDKIEKLSAENKLHLYKVNLLNEIADKIKKKKRKLSEEESKNLSEINQQFAVLNLDIHKNMETRNYLSFALDVSNKKGKFPQLFS